MRLGFTSRYEARPFAAPGVDDNEHISECVLADRHVTFFVPFIVSNRDGLIIVQDGGCVGKVYAVLFEIRSCLPRVPFAIVGHQSIHSVCTYVHTVNSVR